MANTKIFVTELNFKIDEDFTTTTVKFKTDNEPAMGTTRTKKFRAPYPVNTIIEKEIGTLDFLAWPEGDHTPRMTPADYRIIRECADWIFDQRSVGIHNLLNNMEKFREDMIIYVRNVFGADNIGFGEDQYKTINQVIDIVLGDISIKELAEESVYYINFQITKRMIVKRFNV